MNVPLDCHKILNWWITELPNCSKAVSHGPPKNSVILMLLHSLGGYNKTSDIRTGGEWSALEQKMHINFLKLKACQLTIMPFFKSVSNTHICIYLETQLVAFM